MKAAIFDWISELLSGWFVPRVDFEKMQLHCFRMVDESDDRRRRAVEELHQIMEASYRGTYQSFEEYGRGLKTQRVAIEEIRIPGHRWQFTLPPVGWHSLIDTRRELLVIEKYILTRLTDEFRKILALHLFNLTEEECRDRIVNTLSDPAAAICKQTERTE